MRGGEQRTSRRARGAATAGSLVIVCWSLGGCAVLLGPGPTDLGPAGPLPTSSSGSARSTSVAYEDITFVQMMLAHDRQTVQICDLLLAKDGVDPPVRTLAEQMQRSREPEISQLAGWLTAWGVDESSLEHEHAGRTHGLLRPGQLAAFERADGPTAQRAFLETMISHDRAAQEIASTVVADGTDAGVRALARTAITTGEAETSVLERLVGR